MSLLATSVDSFLDRTYDDKNYNCLHFVAEGWFDLTGVDILDALQSLIGAFAERRVTKEGVRAFARLNGPESPCLVVMRRPRTTPHVGIFLRDNVLHIQRCGVQFMPIRVAAFGFKSVQYYK